MANILDERTCRLDGATARLRFVDLEDAQGTVDPRDPQGLARALGVASAAPVLLYVDWDEIGQWHALFLVLEWHGAASWTAVFSSPVGGMVEPVLWRQRECVIAAFGGWVYGLHLAQGTLAWKFKTGEWPVCALAVEEHRDTLFIAWEIGVLAVRPQVGQREPAQIVWDYDHDEVILGMEKHGDVLKVAQWERDPFWLDARTGKRIEGPEP